jgi:uncharacterized protein DUF3859
MKIVSALALALCLAAPALAQTPSCRILNYGIFTEVETYQSRDAPGTAGGKEILAHPRAAIERTDRVPARLGVMFGVVHSFEDIPEGGFVAGLVRHPPLPAAGGGTKTESLLRKEPESPATGFRFDRPGEVVRGDWSFEFHYQGNVLCRQTFIVE